MNPRPRRAALVLIVLVVAVTALVARCGRPPTEPGRGPINLGGGVDISGTDCSGVPVSTDRCDTSTSLPPAPNLPELPCPTRAEIEEIRREIPVTTKSDVSAGVLACRERDGSVDLTIVENQVYQSLLYLRRMRFDRPLPWTSKPVYDWVRDTIPLGIVIESSGNSFSCLRCPGPIHVAFSSYTWVRPTPDALLLNLIAHETRHAEGFPHTCGVSSNPGFNGFVRDKSVAEMGGFGVHYLLSYWIGHYSEEPAPVREYLSAHAARLLARGGFCCECR